ncbi:hypothetical protein OG241_19090 [Streptomyces sp. NBC_01390]
MKSRDGVSACFPARRKQWKSVAFTTALVTVWAVVVFIGVTTITHP